MNFWWENAHLETDFTHRMEFEVESQVFDQRPTQRVYGNPIYDRDGQLRCRACGSVMARSMSRNATGLAVCSDTACPAHGFEFVEGSFYSNPGRRR